MSEQTFTLVIPLPRLNSIVDCMGNGPYRIVADHIDFIEKQCKAQIAAENAHATEEPPSGAAESQPSS